MIDNRYMSVMELKKYLGIGRTAAYKLCRQQDFPTIRIGTKILIDKEQLDSIWLKNRHKMTLKGI